MKTALTLVLITLIATAHADAEEATVESATPAVPSATLTLLSFNVLANDLDQRVDAVAAWIAELKPDIACIQELHTVPNYQRLRQQLEANGYPMDSRQAIEYMGVFSRYPIRDYNDSRSDGYDRRIQTFVVDHPVAGPLRFFQIHPYPGYACTVVPRLLEAAAEYPEPHFFLGDFNLTPDGECFPPILNDHIRACTEEASPSCANTVNREVWCHYNPEACEGQTFGDAAIDHIFMQKGAPFELLEAWSDKDMNLSDHFPVIARYVHTPKPDVTIQTR